MIMMLNNDDVQAFLEPSKSQNGLGTTFQKEAIGTLPTQSTAPTVRFAPANSGCAPQ